ncbi:DUF4198 domain-containing protein [Sphingomonas psychrotolerans]|uniref:DUF4198 domain-containing protein n=1 Tax=Sphingomonas psychrotolerans TaxID=1327635 RepID=A0A2K8MF52_9SPHN|nr:DUF4198 domain-containing protein [Sphingomonas psychrotolerans]ATY32518.1 DUF4198 domain-containing protein [Sphingomonas psychrotolerans]
MKLRTPLLAAAAFLALATPAAVQAHRMWMLPSATIVSGDDVWVTIDAAVSNDLFYFEHQPLRGDPKVLAPDGSTLEVENKATGRYRTTFDVHLTQKGTYKVAIVSEGVMGSYMLGGERKPIPRGTTTATLASVIPAGATEVRTSESANRNEVFITSGEPTNTVFKPTGKGIELIPVTHPNDLVAGETATFQFTLDGKPMPEQAVTVIPGGIRYRDKLNQMDLKTDAAGKVQIKWPEPGMYWLNVTTGGGRGPGMGPGAEGQGASAAPAGPAPRRANYVTTLEVLAP